MPKTKDAFALRDFDASHILRDRRITRDEKYRQARAGGDWYFDFPMDDTLTDSEIIEVMKQAAIKAFERDNLSAYQDKRIRLVLRNSAVIFFLRRLLKHCKRLGRFKEKFGGSARLDELVHKYSGIMNDAEPVNKALYDALIYIDDVTFPNKKIFKERLREARLTSSKTQQELAQMLGLGQSSYSAYELGSKEPSLTTLVKISKILNRSLDWLLGLT